MLIEIDLDEAKRLKITMNQFVLIKLLIDKVDIKSLINVIRIDDKDINNLKEQNILTTESTYTDGITKNLHLTENFKMKYKQRDFFDEFYEAYPTSTTRPDGQKDYLRGDISRCRKYYQKIVGKSLSKHESMLECLNFEVKTRKAGNSLQYMKRMSKWLLSEEWLLYADAMNDVSVVRNADEMYGAKVE